MLSGWTVLQTKPRATPDLLFMTKQPTGCDTKMERQFYLHHRTVKLNFDGGDPFYIRYRQSHDWMAGSVAKWIGVRLYEVTPTNGSTHRFHDNQMRPRSTELTDDDFIAYADNFNLPVRRPQATNVETIHPKEHAGDHNQHSGNQGILALDDVNPEQLSSTLLEHRRAIWGHIPNNLGWTLEENHTSIHKNGPNCAKLFFPPWVTSIVHQSWYYYALYFMLEKMLKGVQMLWLCVQAKYVSLCLSFLCPVLVLFL